jgi:hypothetical protein
VESPELQIFRVSCDSTYFIAFEGLTKPIRLAFLVSASIHRPHPTRTQEIPFPRRPLFRLFHLGGDARIRHSHTRRPHLAKLGSRQILHPHGVRDDVRDSLSPDHGQTGPRPGRLGMDLGLFYDGDDGLGGYLVDDGDRWRETDPDARQLVGSARRAVEKTLLGKADGVISAR